VTSVKEGTNFQDITVEPSGTQVAPEEVLVIIDPVHEAIPETPAADAPEFLAPDINPTDTPAQTGKGLTSADKLRDQYMKIGDAQKHVFGEGPPGSPVPNFNLKVPGVNAPANPVTQASAPGSAPAASDKKTPAAPVAAPSTRPPQPVSPGAAAARPAATPKAPATLPAATKPDEPKVTRP
jgi:hypothetical protein